jgi:hypothetical protein
MLEVTLIAFCFAEEKTYEAIPKAVAGCLREAFACDSSVADTTREATRNGRGTWSA